MTTSLKEVSWLGNTMDTEAVFKEKTRCMRPFARVDYNLTLCVHSRVDSNTFTMGNPMPYSALTLYQSRLSPLVRDFEYDLRSSTTMLNSNGRDWKWRKWIHPCARECWQSLEERKALLERKTGKFTWTQALMLTEFGRKDKPAGGWGRGGRGGGCMNSELMTGDGDRPPISSNFCWPKNSIWYLWESSVKARSLIKFLRSLYTV